MITLEVNNREYSGFKSASVKKSMENMSGSFSFVTSITESDFFPIKRGSSCRVLIDGTPVITGFIENISISYRGESHTIRIRGRDKTADVIDSSLVGSKDFNAPISLQGIIETILANNGITDIKVINNVPDIEGFTSGEFVSAKQSQKVFDFIEKYARKRQVLLGSDGDGNIVMQRATTTDRAIGIIQHDPITPLQNNVLGCSVNYDESERYRNYIVESQLNPVGLSAMDAPTVAIANISEQSGEAADPSVRASRTLIVVPEQSADSKTSLARAIWEKNIRRGKSEEYDVTVQGFHQDEEKTQIWKVNQLIKINDVYADIKAERVIKSVSYSYSADSGSTTEMVCVPTETYSVEPTVDSFKKRNSTEGDALIVSGEQ